LNPARLVSQNQPNQLEIERSGNYFWGQAFNIDLIQTKLEARNDLMYRISNQLLNYSELNTKFDLMNKYIKYFHKPVEEYTKVIAYISKADVQNIIKNSDSLKQNQIKDSVDKISNYNENKKARTTLQLVDKPLEKKSESSAPVENELLIKLISCNTSDELYDLLIKEKHKNTLIFSWNSKSYENSASSENFYIVLIEPSDKHVIAFLEKAKSLRNDLKNTLKNVNIKHEYLNKIQVWIQLM